MGIPKTKPDLPIENSFDDEAATVVIDINKLKEELSSAPIVDEDIPIEFNAHSTNINTQAPLEIDDIDAMDIVDEKIDEEIDDKTEVFSADLTSSLIQEPTAEEELGLEALLDIPIIEKKIKTILFDLGAQDLKNLYSSQQASLIDSQEVVKDHRYDFQVLSNLAELNSLIKKKEEMIVVFHYNQNPKGINTLMKQMNSKFKHVKTMIVARNLSDEKAKLHQATTSGASTYLSEPQNFQDIIEKLKTIEIS